MFLAFIMLADFHINVFSKALRFVEHYVSKERERERRALVDIHLWFAF